MEFAVWVLVAVQILFGLLLLWDNYATEKANRLRFQAIYEMLSVRTNTSEIYNELTALNERLRLRGYRTASEERQLEIDNLN
jgi:hypothetical protein